MQYTSAQANKLLKKLQDAHHDIERKEFLSKEYLLSTDENADDVRPEYDFLKTQNELDTIERQIRAVKHAINLFNTQTVIPEFNMTIDEMIVFLPQLNAKKNKLSNMKSVLPKIREQSMSHKSSGLVEYRYANYDIAEAEQEYEKVCDMLSRAQVALDTINNALTFEIDI